MPAEARRDRLERLTNLMLVLLDTERPLSLREISERVEGYPENKESARQAFERDKKALRELGIPVTTVPIAAEEQAGYIVRPEDYYLPELGLDDDEANALAFAVAAVQLEGGAGRDALSALGHGVGAGYGAPVAVLPAVPALGAVHQAVCQRALLRFRYRGREREVEPYGLAFRQAAWYLVAKDRTVGDAGALRTFRVDRIESTPVAGDPGSFEPPADLDLDAEIQLLPFGARGDDLPVAELEVDGRLAHQVASLVPASAVAERLPAGGVVLRLPVADEPAFVSFVAGLGDAAVVRGPAHLRELVVARLRAHLSGGATARPEPLPPEPAAAPDRDRVAVSDHGEAPGPAPRTSRRPPSPGPIAGERLRRLLAILVHLARVGEEEIATLAERFAMSEDELVHELELAACCGVPPYTPDQLIELIVDGDRVSAYALGHLAHPRRLTPQEGFALAAAATALLDLSGSGDQAPLRRALGKLEAVLGEFRFSLEVDRPELLHELQGAAERHERVEIDYLSSTSPTPSRREVDPYQVVLREGRWYLDGWCHRVDGLRRFQVERVQAVRPTGTLFQSPGELDESLAGPSAFLGGPDAVRVRIAVPADSAFGVEQYAVAPLELRPDGRLETDVLVADPEGFLGRLMLRLGPAADVLSPLSFAGVAAAVAARALRRYEETG